MSISGSIRVSVEGKWKIPLVYFRDQPANQITKNVDLVFYDDYTVSINHVPADVFLVSREDKQLINLIGIWEISPKCYDWQHIDMSLHNAQIPGKHGTSSTMSYGVRLFSNKFYFSIFYNDNPIDLQKCK